MKRNIILAAIAAVAMIGGLAFFWFLREPDAPKDRKGAAQPTYRMQIEGLRFYGMNQGRRVVSITADRLTLRRGNIVFFSTGLTRAALIENAIIDIYAGAPAPSSRNAPPSAGPPLQNRHLPPAAIPKEGTAPNSFQAEDAAQNRELSPLLQSEFDFGGLFAEETFSSLFPVRNIAEIEVSPVTVRLHNDKSLLTEITAARASVRLKDKEILFTGNVRVSAGSSELTTEHLSFLPGTSRLRTDHPFVLKRGDRTLEGTSLTTDLFLQPQ
ncbi:MAG: LPS export ABC transporter periplasmic protein LptC [Syntrophaceae bacterium CG2_30_58_14]|nr:MAG: LPS export ABC transporter periplasmic protein LptC [Syntrophaceae bacterium CG2_30_58_14]